MDNYVENLDSQGASIDYGTLISELSRRNKLGVSVLLKEKQAASSSMVGPRPTADVMSSQEFKMSPKLTMHSPITRQNEETL